MRSTTMMMVGLFLALAGCHHADPNARHIAVTMKKWAFEPAAIHIRRGEAVVLDITTLDVQHGFKVDRLDINEPVQPHQLTSVELTLDRAGEYPMECSILCGPHHEEMRGKIIVE